MGKKAVFKLFYFTSIILTLVLAAITITAAWSSSVSPENSKIMAGLSLALPFLLGLNAILFIYWAIRLRFWVWIPLIAIVFNWNFIAAIYQNPFKNLPSPTQESTLKIATYNVALFGKEHSGYSCKRIAGYMAAENVDILCLQEFGEYGEFTIDSINNALKQWPYYVIPKAEGKNILQIAMYSKYPITNSKLITYPDTPNASMYCDIDINGTTIRVFNNHLQTTNVNQSRKVYEREVQNTSVAYEKQFAMNTGALILDNETKRAYQANVLRNLVAESSYPVVLCGDLNSLPSSYTYRTITNSGLEDGFKTAGKGYAYTYRYFKRLLRIDYIFHSPNIKGYHYYSPDLNLSSDHNPVIMEVGL